MGGACLSKLQGRAIEPSNSLRTVEGVGRNQTELALPREFFEHYNIFVKRKSDLKNANDGNHSGVLGSGSFSTVLKCIHKETGDLRAVKFVEKKKMLGLRRQSQKDKIVTEVHRGISLLRKMNHPGIIKLYDFFESTKAMAVVLEFGKGGELYHTIVRLGQLTELQTVNIAKQLVSAIAYLHKQGFVHRDIKPENIVVMNDMNQCSGAEAEESIEYRVKLIDFGYSRHFDRSARMVSFVGTLNYVAPEIIQRIPYDETVDVWSLGVIVFVLLQGYLPFNLTESFESNDYSLYLDPEDFRHVSLAGKTFISKCLNLTPSKRPKAEQLTKAPWLQESTHKGRRESLQPLNSPTKLGAMCQSPSMDAQKLLQLPNATADKTKHTEGSTSDPKEEIFSPGQKH
jgi:serine/threonine protein kinase